MTASAVDVMATLAAAADPAKAASLARYFKTGPGEYGEGDVFLGLTVPVTRRVARPYLDLPLDQVDILLDSRIHDHRFVALIILVAQYPARPAEIAGFYLAAVRRGRVDNWDLVDASAEFILGEYLVDRPRDVLVELARSESVWEKRVAILSTFGFIKHGDASTTLEIAEILLPDTHDLVQKAVGWMLREVGKRIDRALLIRFLDEHAARMPRVTLSYATEHLTAEQRTAYRALPR
jgi:3-methyladenine DNA glycosylase AlkD